MYVCCIVITCVLVVHYLFFIYLFIFWLSVCGLTLVRFYFICWRHFDTMCLCLLYDKSGHESKIIIGKEHNMRHTSLLEQIESKLHKDTQIHNIWIKIKNLFVSMCDSVCAKKPKIIWVLAFVYLINLFFSFLLSLSFE